MMQQAWRNLFPSAEVVLNHLQKPAEQRIQHLLGLFVCYGRQSSCGSVDLYKVIANLVDGWGTKITPPAYMVFRPKGLMPSTSQI